VTGRHPGELSREEFFALVGQHLTTLYRFVHDEIAAYEGAGELMPNELAMEDVVDDVVIRAYREHVRHPRRRPSESRLLRLAKERLEAEVRRLKAERRRSIQLEEDIPESPRLEQDTMLGEQILYFHQPDEDLKREDIIPDLRVPPPDQASEREELQRCVDEALDDLPEEWRRALELRFLDRVTLQTLAETLGKPVPEAERIVEHARAFLRQRLLETGCVLEAAQS
jgi:RNA polymerase sigma factor (sigma-70 family)